MHPSHPAFVPTPQLPSAHRVHYHPKTPCLCALPPPGSIATGPNARRFTKWMAADWSNRDQAFENPSFFAHIHVCFRPLPWSLLNGYSMYCESAYDYNLGLPYKTSVVLVVNDGAGNLELVSYKVDEPDEFWYGSYEPQLLEGLNRDRLVQMDDACNTMYQYNEEKGYYIGGSRPGKGCRLRRGGKEKETYLDSKLLLTSESYAAWDRGFDLETDEQVWGTAAGPFVFQPVKRLDELVPEEPAQLEAV